MTEIKIHKSPWKALRILAFTAPFIAAGLLMITNENSSPNDVLMGWIGLSFFGLGIPIGLFHLFDRRPQIIINETGIYDRATHEDFINWEIIQDAYPINIHGQKFISIVVSKQFKTSKKKSRFHKGVAKLNEVIGAQKLNIQLGQIKIDQMRLIEFIKVMSQAELNEKKNILKTFSHLLISRRKQVK